MALLGFDRPFAVLLLLADASPLPASPPHMSFVRTPSRWFWSGDWPLILDGLKGPCCKHLARSIKGVRIRLLGLISASNPCSSRRFQADLGRDCLGLCLSQVFGHSHVRSDSPENHLGHQPLENRFRFRTAHGLGPVEFARPSAYRGLMPNRSARIRVSPGSVPCLRFVTVRKEGPTAPYSR
jgi:hypothetical protein